MLLSSIAFTPSLRPWSVRAAASSAASSCVQRMIPVCAPRTTTCRTGGPTISARRAPDVPRRTDRRARRWRRTDTHSAACPWSLAIDGCHRGSLAGWTRRTVGSARRVDALSRHIQRCAGGSPHGLAALLRLRARTWRGHAEPVRRVLENCSTGSLTAQGSTATCRCSTHDLALSSLLRRCRPK
jgi:hypothetical protein